MGRTEAPAQGESRRPRLLPEPPATAPPPDSTLGPARAPFDSTCSSTMIATMISTTITARDCPQSSSALPPPRHPTGQALHIASPLLAAQEHPQKRSGWKSAPAKGVIFPASLRYRPSAGSPGALRQAQDRRDGTLAKSWALPPRGRLCGLRRTSLPHPAHPANARKAENWGKSTQKGC